MTWLHFLFVQSVFVFVGQTLSVVTGRARLGGLPIGAVAVETRSSEKTVPADPAFEAGRCTI
jgi:acetyl-CoA carboxylase carboxyltransferase component